jgi:translation initiation factor IF-2
MIDEVGKALKGMLEPTINEIIDGQIEVRALFSAGKTKKVAGCSVREGRVARDSLVRIIRKGKTIHEAKVNSLKRFKEDAKEVTVGMECGIGVEGFNDFEVGDVIQAYHKEKVL